MPGKLFTPDREPPSPVVGLMLLLGCVGALPACRGPKALTRPAAAVEGSFRPERFAAGFRKLGRSHFRCVARFDAAADGNTLDSVTTETDVWMDDLGNWRLVELNNKDGGREVVLHGREMGVALRYGKMIRRAAEDPEPKHLLEEALGAPFAAWDLLRDVSAVDDFGIETRGGRKVHVYKLTKARHPRRPAKDIEPGDRRGWRRTLVPGTIEGSVVLDDASGVPLSAELKASYTMRRGGSGDSGTPMHGAVDVRASIEDIGRSPRIARPEAEDLSLRQRTVPEEKALLGGLPQAARSLQATP